jgi:hypothetical protein
MLDGSQIPTKEFLATSLSTAIFVGDMVSMQAAGDLEPSTAGAGNAVVGVAKALYDTNGIPVGHPNSAISTKYLASGDSGIVLVALALPGAEFRVQSTGATAATDVGTVADHLATAGDTTLAKSNHELNYSSQASGSSAQLLILDKIDEPNNAWGTNVLLRVVFNESMFVGGVNGV